VDIHGPAFSVRLFRQGQTGPWVMWCNEIGLESERVAPVEAAPEEAVRRALDACRARLMACMATLDAMQKEMGP
jgi:hypothetical protein